MSRRPSSRAAARRLHVESLEARQLMAIAIAENLLVNLDARHGSAGTANWANTGSLGGNFVETGNPVVQSFGPNGNLGVNFNAAGNTDWYTGPVAPAGITGNGTRTIETWVFNPSFDRGEETQVAYGRRNAGDGTNASFLYSTNASFGAVGHWGGPDMPWAESVGNVPVAGEWHHMVYTYDGQRTRVYADGEIKGSETANLNTVAGLTINLAAQNSVSGVVDPVGEGGIFGTLALANVRIHDGVLTPEQVVNNYNEDAVRFGRVPRLLSQGAPDPVHRYSFNGNALDTAGTAHASVINATIAGGQLVMNNTGNSGDANAQYAVVPIGATIGSSASLTFEGWFTITAKPNWQRVMDFSNDTANYMMFSPSSDEAQQPGAFELNRLNAKQRQIGNPIPINTETHFAAVVDAGTNMVRLYINGQMVSADGGILPFVPRGLGATVNNYLGRSIFAGDAAMRGSINEFRVYNTPLSSAQVLGSFLAGPNADLNDAPTPQNDNYTTAEDTVLNVTQFNPTIAYDVPAGTNGNQNFGGSLGMDFNVNQPVYVTQLGVFDSGSNGIQGGTVTARLYNRATQALMATLTFTGNEGTLVGGSRFKPLTTPILLPAGFQGVIVAEGYNASELNGNASPGPWQVNDGGGAITFVGGGRFGNAGQFPPNVDGGPVNRYAAGTFTFAPNLPGPPTLLANDTDPEGNQQQIIPTTNVNVFSANFNNNQIPAGMTLNRNVAVPGGLPLNYGRVQNGRVELTQQVGNQMATMIINKPNPTELLQSFTATFDLLLGSTAGDGADGAAFVYGSLFDTSIFGEDGPGGLEVQFDTHNNGGEAPAIALFYNNVLVQRVMVAANVLETNSFVPVSISVNAAGEANVIHNGTTYFNNVAIPGWAPGADWRFGIGSRTGGLNERAYLDNMAINGATAASVPVAVLNANFNDNVEPANVLFNINAAAVVRYGRLELTPAINNLQGTAVIEKPNPAQTLSGITATFDMLIGSPSGNGADGVNFVYGDVPLNASFGENFAGTGIQVQFDTHDNGGGEAPAIKLAWRNNLLGRVNFTDAQLENNQFVPVRINITPTGLITVDWNGQNIFNQVQIPDWNPGATWRFAIGARTGGLNERAYIDNLNITGIAFTPITTAAGAIVNVNANGTFSYNPTGSAILNALSAGQPFVDSFQYTTFDGDLTATATAFVTVIGVNDPITSAAPGGPYSINEGQSLTLNAAAVDPDTADVFTFSWDLDNDGQFDDATGGASLTLTWAQLNAIGITDNFANRPIRVRASDGFTTVDSVATTLTVVNVAPTVTIDAPLFAAPGQAVDFIFDATDPSPADAAANFTFAIDWDGDGSVDETIVATSPLSVSHPFVSPGTYTVIVTATDKDGGVSAEAEHTIEIKSVFEQDGVLIVGGTDASERILLQPGRFGVQVRIDNKIVGTFGNVVEGMVFGNGGNDTITVAGNLPIPFTIDGGAGNDYITGGLMGDTLIGGDGTDRLLGAGGDDTILGGDGNDTISGGAGNDYLDGEVGNDTIKGDNGNDTVLGGEGNDKVYGVAGNDLVRGGEGSDLVDGGAGNDVLSGDAAGDKLYGQAGNDVLIGGDAFDYLYGGAGEDMLHGGLLIDDSDDALLFLLAEWSTGSLATRIANIEPLIQSEADEDNVADTFYGQTGSDWLILMLLDFVHPSDKNGNVTTSLV